VAEGLRKEIFIRSLSTKVEFNSEYVVNCQLVVSVFVVLCAYLGNISRNLEYIKEAVLKYDSHHYMYKVHEFLRNVDWSGRRSTHAGVRGRGDLAGAIAPRRLPGPPAEGELLERKSTDKFKTINILGYPLLYG
jgi:hypothetical protein